VGKHQVQRGRSAAVRMRAPLPPALPDARNVVHRKHLDPTTHPHPRNAGFPDAASPVCPTRQQRNWGYALRSVALAGRFRGLVLFSGGKAIS
jgi:hypothetical protein